MSERLEDIKEKYMPVEYDFNLNNHDIDWLIDQAERVQELEKTNKKNYWIAADFKFENLKLEEQNKRYREALEYALHKIKIDINSSKMTVGEFDKICTIADYIGKTLEESE